MKFRRSALLFLTGLGSAPSAEALPAMLCNLIPFLAGTALCSNDQSPRECTGPNPNPTEATDSQFNIQFAFKDVPESDQAKFLAAEARWRQVIKGDIRDEELEDPGSTKCGPNPSSIDDLYICAVYEDIDGPKGVLGAAGPRLFRSTSNPDAPLPIVGEMKFDPPDVNFEQFADVIIHEMGHIIGIGTLWSWTRPLLANRARPCPYHADSKASNEWRCLTGCTNSIPTEQDGNGSICGHFNEVCLQDEIMTGKIGENGGILSRLTIAALEDLGYLVNYNSAEDFPAENVLESCRCNVGGGSSRRLGEAAEGLPEFFRHDEKSSSNSPRILEDYFTEDQLSLRNAAIEWGKQALEEQKFGEATYNENAVYDPSRWISVFYADDEAPSGLGFVLVWGDEE